jgi:hypothetical protein
MEGTLNKLEAEAKARADFISWMRLDIDKHGYHSALRIFDYFQQAAGPREVSEWPDRVDVLHARNRQGEKPRPDHPELNWRTLGWDNGFMCCYGWLSEFAQPQSNKADE